MRESMNTPTPTQAIARDLRRKVLAREFLSGTRLPTRAALREQYHTTLATLDRVFTQLAREGIVTTDGRRGTFVASAPPFLRDYRLVLPYRDQRPHPWPQFWKALAAEAAAVSKEGRIRIALAYGNEMHEDTAHYEELARDVADYRVGGVIIATHPFYLRGSPVYDTLGVPRVAIADAPEPPKFRVVEMDPCFLSRAVQHLLERGRRRIAAVVVEALRSDAAGALRSAGVESPPYWVQTANPAAPAGARNLVHLLMAAPPRNRPNGLIVFDDNLVPDATAGLVDAGVRVPQDVLVIGHTNFPHPTPSAVPSIRVGYDARAVLGSCMSILESWWSGPQDKVTVPLMVEEEEGEAKPMGDTAESDSEFAVAERYEVHV